MNVILEIDELILDGLGPLDGQAVRAAVERELAGLIRAGGVTGDPAAPQPSAGRARHGAGGWRVTGSETARSVSISLPRPPYPAATLGAQVARAIYGGLRQ